MVLLNILSLLHALSSDLASLPISSSDSFCWCRHVSDSAECEGSHILPVVFRVPVYMLEAAPSHIQVEQLPLKLPDDLVFVHLTLDRNIVAIVYEFFSKNRF